MKLHNTDRRPQNRSQAAFPRWLHRIILSMRSELDHLLRRQHGVLTREQALGNGIARRALQPRTNPGRLYRVHPRVYSVIPPPLAPPAAMTAGLLYAGAGTALARYSAAALWHFPLPPGRAVYLLLPDRRRLTRQVGLVLSRTRSLLPGDLRRVDGYLVTSLERTVVDLAAALSARETLALVAELLRINRTDVLRLRSAVVGRARLPGAAAVARALAQLAGGLESPLEVDALQRLIRAAGLPEPVPQYVVRHEGHFIARVDFAWPALRVALEVDGRVAHLSVGAFERDASRELALQALGWQVVRVTGQLLSQKPTAVVRALLSAMSTRCGN